MNMIDIITKKRDGGKLSEEEIRFFVEGFTKGEIPDYQASALLMSIFFSKMDEEETFILTDAMKNSGAVLDLSDINGIKIDKHSTGGVGDKTTLVVAPIAAACGVPIAKMSGRGLGFTGGTIDKLESIPGFSTSISTEDFKKNVNEIGMAVVGQTEDLAKADKLIYALRDVTATVDNISLITSSIMSKKLAAGSDGILLDVKCGKGAFMHTEEDALALAKAMVKIGKQAGKKTVAIITDMNQPLGTAIGNSSEVVDAIKTLRGQGPKDLEKLSIELAGLMIYMGGKADSHKMGRDMAKNAIADGSALEKFKEFVKAQGGDDSIVEDVSKLPRPEFAVDIKADTDGFVTEIDCLAMGRASQLAGAGRATKEDPIDLSAGIIVYKKIGDEVKKGDVIARVFGNDPMKLKTAIPVIEAAYSFGTEMVKAPKLIKCIVGLED